ncbi:hypothetical protein AX14_007505 [Amanita brunnescens Koide BX004]|nr:hypothetical protein AX14_007505 [Amanita brunnescens Koide BX004]
MFTKVVFLVFLALPFTAQYVSAAKCSRTYVVKEGDTCDSISREHNVSTYQLAAVNEGIIAPGCTELNTDKRICLGIIGNDCTATRAVRRGDTCDSIQAETGITAAHLHHNNPQINESCTNIYIGQVLCVANFDIVRATPSGGVVVVPPSTAVPANSGATGVHAHHSPTRQPSTYRPSASTPAPAASPSPDDDDDLPFCDEL